MNLQDLSIWHGRRTVGNAYRRGGRLSFQQLYRATDHAEASVSVAGAAAIPSPRQLGSSTNSRSEPDFIIPFRSEIRLVAISLALWGPYAFTSLRNSPVRELCS